MLFNNNTNCDPRSFMYYKGEYYINGTEITLTDDYIKNNLFNEKKLWKYARFDHQTQHNGYNAYFFCAIKLDCLSLHEMNIDVNARKDYASYFIIEAYKIESVINKITKPIKLTKEENEKIQECIIDLIEHPKTDLDYPKLLAAWIIYIIIMIASLIFNQFYIIWFVASYIFFMWRKDILRR